MFYVLKKSAVYGKTSTSELYLKKMNALTTFWTLLVMWPLASERTLSYTTPQCVGILLTFFINQVMWPFDVWK